MNNVFQPFCFSTTENLSRDPVQYFVEELPSDIHEDDEDFNDEDENGNSSLIFAALQGKEDLVRTLVDQGAFVNHQNHNGETALYWAASQGHEKCVDFLVENGANLNVCNLDGVSPAHVAAANGHCNIVAKLIRNGAYVNAQDDVKDSILHYAVREGQKEVALFLVEVCKAKVDIKNEDLETPLELAQCLEPSCMDGTYSSIIKILNEHSQTSPSLHNLVETKLKLEPFHTQIFGNPLRPNNIIF